MVRNHFSIYFHSIWMLVFVGMLGCDGTNSTSNDPANPGTTAATTTTTTTTDTAAEELEQVNLSTPSPSRAMSLALNAIGKELDINLNLDTSSSLNLTAIEIETTDQIPDPDTDGDGKLESQADDAKNYKPDPDFKSCSQYAEPMANATTILSEQDPTYAKAKIDCLISTPNSSESLAGSLAQIKGILCAFENAIGGSIEFEESPGKKYEQVEVKIDTTCFTAAQVESLSENGSSFKLDFTALKDESKSFPNRITINMEGNPIHIDLLATEDVFSFAKIETDSNGNPDDITIVSMERAAGIIRAVRKSLRHGDVVTLLVSGEMNEDGVLTSIDRKDSAYGRFAYPGNDTKDTSLFNGTFVTSKGDNANGVHYRYANYRCGQFGDTINNSTTGPCTDIDKGAFTNRRESCDARGADECLLKAPVVNGDALPFFAVAKDFNSTYTNPDQDKIDAVLTAPDTLCFDEITFSSNPNASCHVSELLGLDATKPKAVNFRRSKQNPFKERRISDWTDLCGQKTGTVDIEYLIGGSRSIGKSLISALNSGSNHTVSFNILAPVGSFYADYSVEFKVYKNDEELASKTVTTPNPVAKAGQVSMPITLGGFTADDTLKLTAKGSFKCASTVPGKKLKAYSMTVTPGGPTVLFNP